MRPGELDRHVPSVSAPNLRFSDWMRVIPAPIQKFLQLFMEAFAIFGPSLKLSCSNFLQHSFRLAISACWSLFASFTNIPNFRWTSNNCSWTRCPKLTTSSSTMLSWTCWCNNMLFCWRSLFDRMWFNTKLWSGTSFVLCVSTVWLNLALVTTFNSQSALSVLSNYQP